MATVRYSFCRGDTPTLSIKFKLPRKSYIFTTTDIVVSPSVGDVYSVGTNNMYVYAVNGNLISVYSDLKNDIIEATGTLTKVTGLGDTNIIYTSKTSSDYINLTGLNVIFSILSTVVNEPSVDQILLSPTEMTVNQETAFINLTSAQTLNFPVTIAYGFFEIKNNTNYISESLDNQYLVIDINKEKIQPIQP